MDGFNLWLPGKPISKARPRFTGKGAIDPQSRLVKAVGLMIKKALPEDWDASLSYSVSFSFMVSMPKGVSKMMQSLLVTTQHLCYKRPDLDNYIKFYLDAANGILWDDDCKVVRLIAEKAYSTSPGVNMRVFPLL